MSPGNDIQWQRNVILYHQHIFKLQFSLCNTCVIIAWIIQSTFWSLMNFMDKHTRLAARCYYSCELKKKCIAVSSTKCFYFKSCIRNEKIQTINKFCWRLFLWLPAHVWIIEKWKSLDFFFTESYKKSCINIWKHV